MSAAPAAGQGRARSAGSEMLARFASAGVLAALTLLCAWLGGWPAAIGVSIVVAVVYGEWAALTRDDLWPTLVFTAALVAAFAALAAGFAGVAIGVAVAAIVVAAVLSRGPWRPVGVAYGAVLGFGLLLLRLAPEHGLAAVVFLFAVVWGGGYGRVLHRARDRRAEAVAGGLAEEDLGRRGRRTGGRRRRRAHRRRRGRAAA